MGFEAALALLILGASASPSESASAGASYVGARLGALSQLHHAVRGTVYAVDSRTIFLQDFHYDGEGPAAYFYVGTSGRPSASGGLRLRDERGGTGPLRKYRGEGVTLALPDGHTLKDLRWFAVWCDEFSVNFGDITIPRDVEYPRPARAGALRGVHGVSSDPIVVVDAQTILVPNFSYDGEAPDAKFWVGRGEKPSPQGIRIPDENGKEAPLRKYDKKTIVLTLPGELTVFDIGHFAVWCEAFTVNFGHVALPRDLISNVPPSLKMLGVSPQSKLNCEVLLDDLAFEVRWAVAGDSIVVQLVAKLEDGEYMSFGISGDAATSQMVGADVAVAWVDKQTLKGYAVDYYLDAKSQCAGVRGSCPDERLSEKTNSIRLLNAALVNGYSIVTYQRSLKAADQLDLPILTNGSQPIVWALGPLNSRAEVSYHHHFTKGDRFIEFGRPPVWNCPMPEGDDEPRATTPPAPPAHRQPVKHSESEQSVIKPNPVPAPAAVERVRAWDIPGIQCHEPPDGVFYAQMGPTGGKHGYSAITGHVGWGISWYINGLLIPEVTVVRGRKYTFVVEGGVDPNTPARYHPFYITNDPVGGYFHKSDEEKKGVEIYAGVRRLRSGEVIPTGVGRLCNWTPDESAPPADDFPSFGAYQRSLTLVCDEGNPGLVTWTPDHNTPDTVYYQCFTHRHLGWKINVVDECDIETQESRIEESVVLPDDLQQEESIQVPTRIKPDSNFLDHRRKVEKIINTKTNYNDFSSDKDGVLTGEIYAPEFDRNRRPEYEKPIMSEGQIHDVIQAVENLETRMKEARRNETAPHQYLVHEEPEGAERPERPVREDDEYVVQPGRAPESYFLPPGGSRPLTLQAVLRPAPHRPHPPRPYRRPAPPDIKLRRPAPHPTHPAPPKVGFPLSMPTHSHPSHQIPKKPYGKPQFGRKPPMMNRPPQGGIPPMKAMPPLQHSKPNFGPPKQVPKPQSPVQMIIMGKPNLGKGAPPSPSQTLSLGHTDVIANQVVGSHITLPGSPDSAASSSVHSLVYQPGQIILGKPMDHPVPLDQQMMPNNKYHSVITAPPTPPPEAKTSTSFTRQPTPSDELTNPHNDDEIKSSDFMGESTEQSTLRPAMNTGFKPNTIVIESGFKPIIREPLMDRVGGDYDVSQSSNRREDTDVVEDYEEAPQPISNHAYETPSDKLTQSFEPMFIPSPVDLLLPSNDRTKEVFPKNHAKEDRPHPVYVKTESELNALFSKNNMEKEVPSDMIMESDRVSPQYLPPDPKLPKEHSQKLSENEETFTTYDGKTVSAATLTSVSDVKVNSKIFSAKLPSNSEQLLKTPQFGPFRGEIPPAVAGSISGTNGKDNPHSQTTHLKLVNPFKSEETNEPIKAEGSERFETIADLIENKPMHMKDHHHHEKGEHMEEKQKKHHDGDFSNEEEYDEYVESEEERSLRRRRDASPRERGEVQEQKPFTQGKSNQIDYQIQSTSTATTLHWTSLLILPLLGLRIF